MQSTASTITTSGNEGVALWGVVIQAGVASRGEVLRFKRGAAECGSPLAQHPSCLVPSRTPPLPSRPCSNYIHVMRHWGPKRAQQHLPEFARRIVAEVHDSGGSGRGQCSGTVVASPAACSHALCNCCVGLSRRGAGTGRGSLAAQASRMIRCRSRLCGPLPPPLPLLQYDQKGEVSARAVMKGPMPGGKR